MEGDHLPIGRFLHGRKSRQAPPMGNKPSSKQQGNGDGQAKERNEPTFKPHHGWITIYPTSSVSSKPDFTPKRSKT